MEYQRILQAAAGQPWAIDETKGRAIAEFLAFKALGGSYSAEEIEARTVGDSDDDMAQRRGGVAVIPLHGVMFQRAGMMRAMSGGISSERVAAAVSAAVSDGQVETIMLHIDSPGGAVYGTRELAMVVADAARRKNVVAMVDSVAASAAYWVATQASEIVVTPGGDVGSIGVLAIHEEISRRLEAEGVTKTIISAGAYKAEGNPYEPLGDEAQAYMQARVDEAYGQFISAVAAGRGVDPESVQANYGQGRVLSAQRALAAGMVDTIATFQETLNRYTQAQGARGGNSDRYSRRALAARVAKTKAG